MKMLVAGTLASLALLSTSVGATETFRNGQSIYGKPAVAGSQTRVVDTRAGRTVNVKCGDTLTFVNGAQRFTWTFDVATHRRVALSKIAPADFGPTAQAVYVERNPSERGG